jgi:hypothetical protein
MSRFLWTQQAVADAIEQHTERRYTVGVDLGQTIDPTAVAVIEKQRKPALGIGRVPDPLEYFPPVYRVRHLERIPLRSSYPDIVSHVGRLMATAPLSSGARLVIDQTGVGRPIYDMFRAAGLRPTGITITSGDSWSCDGDSYRVSKLLLVSRLQAALHSGLLQVASSLPEAAALKAELADFRVNYTATGYSQFGAREGRHDDLVLSVAIALWHAVTVGSQKIHVAPCLWG